MRTVGGLLLGYVVAYTAQYILSALYDSGGVWSVMNVISAIGILVALVLNIDHAYRHSGPASEATDKERLGAGLLVYVNIGLSVWFFHNWIRLLMLNDGESVQVHHDVIWQFIAVLIVLVFAATGWRLWHNE